MERNRGERLGNLLALRKRLSNFFFVGKWLRIVAWWSVVMDCGMSTSCLRGGSGCGWIHFAIHLN